jgi:hypothetical protein
VKRRQLFGAGCKRDRHVVKLHGGAAGTGRRQVVALHDQGVQVVRIGVQCVVQCREHGLLVVEGAAGHGERDPHDDVRLPRRHGALEPAACRRRISRLQRKESGLPQRPCVGVI